MSRASPATLELAEHFTTIRLAGETVRTGGATPLTVGTLFAATLLATELHQDKADDDLRRLATYREFRRYAVEQLLPCLEDALLSSLSLEGGLATRPVAPADLARCLVAVGRLVDQPHGSARVGIELTERVVGASREMRIDAAPLDLADLPMLIGHHRRIDEMSLALDVLGDPTSAEAVRQHSRILARATLGRISATMEAGLMDLARRSRLAASVAATDLLAVALRVVDGVRAEFDPATRHYTEDLGLAALRHFAAAILAIEHQALSACQAAVEQAALPAEAFALSLRLLTQLRGLARGILSGTGPAHAAGAERAAGQALELLRAPEIIKGIESMARALDLALMVRARDGSDRQHRLDGYAAAFEAFTSAG